MQLGKIPLLHEGKAELAATFATYFKPVTCVASCEVRLPTLSFVICTLLEN
jgi:hypothetical protein